VANDLAPGLAAAIPYTQSYEHAERLLAAGAVWHTMVLVAKGEALLRQFRQHLPDLTQLLEATLTLDEPGRSQFVNAIYPEVPGTISRITSSPPPGPCRS
jgi:hypothetical protein